MSPGPSPETLGGPTGIVVAALVIVAVVAGIIVAISRAGAAAAPATPSSVAAKGDVCVPPRCKTVATSVTVTWNEPGGGPVGGYTVYRDGIELRAGHDVDPHITSFVDQGLQIGATYRYQVVAFGNGGTSARSPTVEATIPTPPIRAAQLDGKFRVRIVVVRAANLGKLEGIEHPRAGDHRSATWSFAAACYPDRGACPTNWFGRLVPHGVTYVGSFPAAKASCFNGVKTPTHIDMRLKVTKAAALDSFWRASAFKGTYTVSFSCHGGFSSIGVLGVTGRLLA